MYKFRCDLRGHTSDVRCLVHYDEEVIISGSRDKTCRVWTSNNGIFEPGNILCGHTEYIASLCILPSSETYPDGLIVTGSNDHSICCYTPKSTECQFKLLGHTNTVCCVNPAISGICGLLSSSWDSSVIMWDMMTRSVAFRIFGQNKTPVWSVIQLESGTIITASADKILRAYTTKGAFIRSFYGHSDCVRCLFPVSRTHFISCGNDGHVLRWNTENTSCDAAIDSVHHFLYSVCNLPGSELIAYVGERGGIYINTGTGSDFIPVPCTSVWSVTILPDGDIAAACSDGVIRLYTCDPRRYADDFNMRVYQNQVQKFAIAEYAEKQKDMFHPYLNDLAGPELLNTFGTVSNQICFVRSGFLAVMYSWSTDRWVELAKRKGTYQYDITKKKMLNGKAYDFLFPINIEDNRPNLILPLTLGDDILEKISEFISVNSLSTHYGETIYNHIATTIKDDFIKASILESSVHSTVTADDYYDSLNKFFPKSSFVTFEKANIGQIIAKLSELSSELSLQISHEETETLKNLTSTFYTCTPDDCATLISLLSWPEELMLPVLDLLRLAIRNSSFHSHVFTTEEIKDTIRSTLAINLLNELNPVNQLMALKVNCNMFMYVPGKRIIAEEYSNIITSLSCMKFPANFSASLQVAASSLMLNLTILSETDPTKRIQCLNCVASLLTRFTDKEALYRTFIAVGNLISYEGSFFIPKPLITTLRTMYTDGSFKGSQAHECLCDLMKCFQDQTESSN